MGARMVEFAGWWMPVQYSGIMQEARAVRENAGMFDISHMGRFHLRGDDIIPALEKLTTNDVSALTDGAAQYSLLTNPQGGVIDDIIVYRLASDHFLVVVNAANADKDRAWMLQHLPSSVSLEDATAQTAMIAVQGPKAVERVSHLLAHDLTLLPRFHVAVVHWSGHKVLVARTATQAKTGWS